MVTTYPPFYTAAVDAVKKFAAEAREDQKKQLCQELDDAYPWMDVSFSSGEGGGVAGGDE